MSIDRIFLAFMAVCGIVAGAILVAAPESRNLRITPYFWVLIAMALFELAQFARTRGAPGTMVSIEARLFGLVLAIVLMVTLPIAAGSPGRLF
jgi:membrane associated rhomboid family serine protease